MTDVSVIVAARACEPELGRSLTALAAQEFPHAEYEVIVVLPESFTGSSPGAAPFQLIHSTGAEHAGAAINRALRSARGRVCVFLTGDLVAGTRLVAEHAAAHLPGASGIALGRILTDVSGGSVAREILRAETERHDALERRRREPSWTECMRGNFSLTRADLLAAGAIAGESERELFGELAIGVQARTGAPIAYVPAAACRWQPSSTRQALRAAECDGRTVVAVARRHPDAWRAARDFNERPGRSSLIRRLLLCARAPVACSPRAARLARVPDRDRDALASPSYAYWRGVRAAATRAEWWHLTVGASVLMYHAVAQPGEAGGRFLISARRLDLQMRTLRWLGRRPISLGRYVSDRREGRTPPARSIVVTFDDGYADNVERAAPILERRGVPAMIFVVTRLLGEDNRWDDAGELAGRRLMSRDQLLASRSPTIGFGAHTRSHRPLPSLSADERLDEVAGSRQDLAELLAGPVDCFAYPYGRGSADPECVATVARAGFIAACTVTPGRNSAIIPLAQLRRTEVFGTDSWLRFAQAVLLGDAEAIWRRRRRRSLRRSD